MRAEVDRVDPGPARRKLRNHFLVNFVHQRFRKNISRNAGLVRHDDHRNIRLIQLADRFGCIRKNLEAVDVIDVAHFLADRAVAVQKHGAAQKFAFQTFSALRTERFFGEFL